MTRQSRYGRGQRLFVSATPVDEGRGEGFEIRESSAEDGGGGGGKILGTNWTDDGWVQFDEGQAGGGGGGGGGGRSVRRRRPQLNRLGSWPCCPELGNCSASTVLVVFCVEAPWKGEGTGQQGLGANARVCGAICHGRRGVERRSSGSGFTHTHKALRLVAVPPAPALQPRRTSNHTTRRSGARIDMGRTSFPSPTDLVVVVAVDGSNVLRRTRKPCGQSSFPDQREGEAERPGRADRRAATGG